MTKRDCIALAAAFVGGAVAGAAAGLLFAPEKGDDTRRKINESLKNVGVKLNKEQLNKLVEDLKSKLTPGQKEEVPSEDFDVE